MELYTKEQRFQMRTLILIANKMITINWKDAKSTKQWTQKPRQVYTLERMATSLQMKMDIFDQRWVSVATYLEM